MKAVITGGGTGGHIYPALAIGEKLRDHGWQVIYLGVEGAMEDRLSQQQGFPFYGINAEPLSVRPDKLFHAVFSDVQGVYQAKKILKDFHPDVVVGTGGFASAPAIRGAQNLHIPTVLHEQNAFPGKANRLLAKNARAVCLTFPDAGIYFQHPERHFVTGLPIRQQILLGDRKTGREALKIPENAPLLLITGGSLGAEHLNRCAMSAADQLMEDGWYVVHLCGRKAYQRLCQVAPKHTQWQLFPYMDHMEYPLYGADLALCRAGASFLSELSAVGLPSILVPYPHAAGDHQRFNAQSFCMAGAARMLEDQTLTGSGLLTVIRELRSDPSILPVMAECTRKLGKPDAADQIYSVIQTIINRNRQSEE